MVSVPATMYANGERGLATAQKHSTTIAAETSMPPAISLARRFISGGTLILSWRRFPGGW